MNKFINYFKNILQNLSKNTELQKQKIKYTELPKTIKDLPKIIDIPKDINFGTTFSKSNNISKKGSFLENEYIKKHEREKKN